jgi:hypothetical protein
MFVSMFTHIKLSGKNLQTNFDYSRLKITHHKPCKLRIKPIMLITVTLEGALSILLLTEIELFQ